MEQQLQNSTPSTEEEKAKPKPSRTYEHCKPGSPSWLSGTRKPLGFSRKGLYATRLGEALNPHAYTLNPKP